MKVNTVSNSGLSPNFNGANPGKLLQKAANINSWQQRAALGVAAMTLQPLIDFHNKDVDKKTRKVSAARSFSKAAVGVTTGIITRLGSMKAVEQIFKNEKFTGAIAKMTAEDQTQQAIEKSKDFIKNQGGAKKYAAIMGTVLALGVMTVTNFVVDAPLTNCITNKINKKAEEKDSPADPKGVAADGI